MYLTPHFTLEELTFSERATRLGIDNTPEGQQRTNLRRVALLLEEVRALFGRPLVVSSGYRSPALNAATPGSSSTSAHTQGLAADFTVPGIPVLEVCKKIRDSGLIFDQLIFEGSWVHLGLSDALPRQEVLRAVFNANGRVNYPKGLPS